MALSGVHHLALFTKDMKAQIEFFTQLAGMELIGLFPMHGVEGASHCFLRMGEDSYLSFVQVKGVAIEGVIGISHAGDAGGPVAGGAMQHVAIKVDSYREMLDIRDRFRLGGYAVFGPLSHGMSYSMYLGAPEGILLEFSTPDRCEPFTSDNWVDPKTATEMGITEQDLGRYVHPVLTAGQGGAVLQPDPATSVYPTPIPKPMFEALGQLPDDELQKAMQFHGPETPANASHQTMDA